VKLTFLELRTYVAAGELDLAFSPFGYREIPITLADLDILLDEGTVDPTDLIEIDMGDDDGDDTTLTVIGDGSHNLAGIGSR
jgi:hypothetical protein